MTFTLLVRRSNVAGHVPTYSQLSLGEIALNTNDGLIYFARSTGTSNTVVALGPVPATANALTNAVTISLSGDANGSVSFNGSANVAIPVTLATLGTAGTYTAVVTDTKGRVANGLNMTASGDASGTASGSNIVLTLAASGTTAGTYYGGLVVNAKGLVTAASPLVTYSGDVTSNTVGANVTLTLNTVNSTPGTYWGVVVNAKGLVTSGATPASNLAINGYQKLPSGLIIQWGSTSVTGNGSQSLSVVLPVTFPTAILSAQVTDANGSFATTAGIFWSVNLANTSAIIVNKNAPSTSPNPAFFNWTALGY